MKLLKHFATGLSVKRKGLLLVGIPLIFQVLLTALLGVLYNQAEQQALKEAQSRLLMARSNRLIKALYQSGETLFFYITTPSKEKLHAVWLARKENMLNEMDSIKQLSLERPNSSKAYERLLDISNRGIKMMDESFRRASDKNIIQTFPELKDFMESVSRELDFVLTNDLEDEVQSSLSEENLRKLIATSLYAGISIDVLIAVALSQFFGSSIERRLRVISQNTQKMRDREELNPASSGEDEIAQLDRDFHELSAELKKSEQLRSEFISMVSHDLKTPLMSVELSLDHIKSELSTTTSASVLADLKSVNANMRSVMSLIQDVLELERGSSGKLSLQIEELSVDDVFARLKTSLQSFAKQKGVDLLTESHDESIFADRHRLDQVLVNLVSNAVRFSPVNSAVVVSAKEIGEEIEMRVTDSGPGVAAEDRELIFERFVQSSSSAPAGTPDGTGLGLAICKTIVDSHGGTIGFEPNPTGGSQFWLRLKSAQSPSKSF